MKVNHRYITILLLLMMPDRVQAASGASVKYFVTPSFSSGGYGSATETVSMTNIPLGLKYKNGPFSAKAVANYLLDYAIGVGFERRF
ncbi:MAG: hypothetical protein AABY83_11580 [Pseudomonadota bacterium]